jgi:tRNA (guanine37-N1)-methyltransferase
MWLGVISLFPDMFRAISENGVTGRAITNKLLSIECWNPRDFTLDKHRTVDDRPYGGGPGMLMMVQPLRDAINAAKQSARDAGHEAKVIYLSPQGRRLDHQNAQSLSSSQALILVAGRYEGIDERIIESLIDEEWSVGDYVLSGGELPAMILIDAMVRFVPGVLGHSQSAEQDSFADGLLDCPHYTRPEVLDGKQVPSVLLSGDHEKIRQWRLTQSLLRTKQRRPDLLHNLALTDEQAKLLAALESDSD